RRLGVAAGAFGLIYTIWWSGFVAPFAVLYFFGSCFFLGRVLYRESDRATAILLGLSVWMLVIWTALHFPVNNRWVYWVALAIPYCGARRLKSPLQSEAHATSGSFGLAMLWYFLLAYWLISLKPEVSADGVSMHLALPMAVAHDARWAFDFRQY